MVLRIGHTSYCFKVGAPLFCLAFCLQSELMDRCYSSIELKLNRCLELELDCRNLVEVSCWFLGLFVWCKDL